MNFFHWSGADGGSACRCRWPHLRALRDQSLAQEAQDVACHEEQAPELVRHPEPFAACRHTAVEVAVTSSDEPKKLETGSFLSLI